jgi:hypothetical protein
MSEYWKSTPKYWCKHCSDFVKDTPFSRREHDASPKHQRNIQRSLRDLHRGKEREEREKLRAQREIERLNGVVPGSSTSGAAGAGEMPWKMTVKPAEREAPKQLSQEERKKQIAKLAEMGVAVPEEFRRDFAMAGSWETTAVRRVGEEGADTFGALSTGVRKRRIDEEEEAEELAGRRRGWGIRERVFPGGKGEGDEDVLMAFGKEVKTDVKKEEGVKVEAGEATPAAKQEADVGEEPVPKVEPAEKTLSEVPEAGDTKTPPELKTEEKPAAPAVVFKKRKKAKPA